MERVIVERDFAEPLTDESIQGMDQRARGCYGNWRVRRVRTYMSRDRKRTICEYEAPDAESVRRASEAAGIPYSKVWTADVLD